jgi:acetate kinase
MATRPGHLDPGAVLWLASHIDEPLDRVFEHESGLLGLCGTEDFRTVMERADRGDADAELAREVVRHRLVTELGAMIAALGGVDAIALSGGIGANAAWVHTTIGSAFEWLGVAVDPDAGRLADDHALHEISSPEADVRTFLVGPGEALIMADHALGAIATSSAPST